MRIFLNGEERVMDKELSLGDLLSSLSLSKERVAIELNKSVVRKRDWDSTMVGDGDHIEVVHFVGGG